MLPFDSRDQQAVTALRVLAVDQVEAARSGHPGLPLGVAPMAYALWSRFLRFDPTDPTWPDRDRFVLSAGHGSALLYALLHLFGYDLPLAELKRFRQWGSLTPGHPEHGLTAGVEVTTGPLGQGIATAVGLALAERHLAARFNDPGLPLFDHRTFVIASDGDMMEGISHEAASLAGHLKLGRLIVLYDDNRISIEGPTSLAYSDDVGARFSGYGWRVLHVDDGNDLDAIAAAVAAAAADESAPALIRVRTHIGYGAPTKQDTAEAHGAPLGPEEAAATRRALGWPIAEPFVVPPEVHAHCRTAGERGAAERRAWRERLEACRHRHPERTAELERRLAGALPDGWDAALPDFAGVASTATREASGKALNALAARIPELIGGSADLAPSTNTLIAGEGSVAAGDYGRRNIRFGVREHAMGALANGLALHGGVRPYASTFLVFADYMRPAIRLAAIMEQPVVYVFTYDSVGVGEDGPTHQPIEHIVSLRIIPGLHVIRPGDAHETAQAWQVALARRNGPTALILSRQKLPVLPPPAPGAVAHGAFVRAEASGGVPDVVLIATGSEVALALEVRTALETRGIPARVVSAPCLSLLAEQPADYRRAVLGGDHSLKVAIEMGRAQGWHRWVGDGEIVSLQRFGASAPGPEVARRLGFSVEAITARVLARVAARRATPLASAVPADLEGVLAGRRARLQTLHVCRRLRIRDAAMWGDRHAKEVARRLGWLDLPARTAGELPGVERLVAGIAGDGARTLYLLGMGGSSLAARVLRETLGNPSGRELVVVDTTDPERVAGILDACDPATAAVAVISKSGETAETTALLAVFWARFEHELGAAAGARFVAVTEHGTDLERVAAERRFRACLTHPTDVNGRFAALSVVGVLPAVWLGIDAAALLAAGARALADPSPTHPAIELALLIGAVAPTGLGMLAWCASPGLAPLGAWAEQLVATSTGKEGRGILPVRCDNPPAPEAAWSHTLYLSPRFADEDTGALDGALDALAAAGHPVVRWRLGRDGLGEAFAALELATAVVGLLLGVNPFDEPDVVRSRERARAALNTTPAVPPAPPADPARALLAHLVALNPLDAVALLAYLPETDRVTGLLAELGRRLQQRTGRPVTAAFGPRCLHTTGQLLKGGPAHTVPVVLTADPARDIAIPGRRFTLGRLRYAQALGDARALADAGRKVLHLHLGADPAALLERAIADLGGT
jgi:transketolase